MEQPACSHNQRTKNLRMLVKYLYNKFTFVEENCCPVAQRVDNAIHQITDRPVDSVDFLSMLMHWIASSRVNSVFNTSNSRPLLWTCDSSCLAGQIRATTWPAHWVFPIQLRLPLLCSEWPVLENKIQPSVLQFTSVSLQGPSIDLISCLKMRLSFVPLAFQNFVLPYKRTYHRL